MNEISSIPVLMEDMVAFDDPKDLGLILATLHNNGSSWLFIGGADALRMQQPIQITLGLRGVPRPVVEVECTPRYQSPGAVGCEVKVEESEAAFASIDALLDVVAAARKGGGPPPPATGNDDASVDQGNPFEGDDSTLSDADAPEAPKAPKPIAVKEPAPDVRGAPRYRVTGLHGVDQLLALSGGIEAPAPMGSGEGDERPCLLLTLLEFLGIKSFTGVLTIEWDDAHPVESTVIHIRKGDMIHCEDRGEDQPDAEEAFLKYLIKEKVVVHDETEDLRSKREETGKSFGNLLFESGLMTLDRLSESMRAHKEESFFDILFREGAGIGHVRPKMKIKGHPIRVNISRNCILWVRKVLLEQYRRNLDPHLAKWMQLYPEVNQEATRYPLTWLLKAQKEAKTAETVLTGAVLAQECFEMAPVSQHDLARMFFLLTRYGALEWRDLPKTLDDSHVLTREQQLEQHLIYLRDSNLFTRLGVHWATHPTDIEAKYLMVKRKYAPESRYAKHSDETRVLCQEISDLLKSSRERLMDRKTRMEERGRIVEESQGRFAAQFMEKQARIIKFRGETILAIQTLEMAAEIYPNPNWIAMMKMWKAGHKSS